MAKRGSCSVLEDRERDDFAQCPVTPCRELAAEATGLVEPCQYDSRSRRHLLSDGLWRNKPIRRHLRVPTVVHRHGRKRPYNESNLRSRYSMSGAESKCVIENGIVCKNVYTYLGWRFSHRPSGRVLSVCEETWAREEAVRSHVHVRIKVGLLSEMTSQRTSYALVDDSQCFGPSKKSRLRFHYCMATRWLVYSIETSTVLTLLPDSSVGFVAVLPFAQGRLEGACRDSGMTTKGHATPQGKKYG